MPPNLWKLSNASGFDSNHNPVTPVWSKITPTGAPASGSIGPVAYDYASNRLVVQISLSNQIQYWIISCSGTPTPTPTATPTPTPTATATPTPTPTPTPAPPTATNLSAPETYTEDTALNLIDIVVSDVDSAAVTATLTLSNPSAGSLSTGTSGPVTSTYNSGTGVWTASGAIANINILLAGVTYNPAANFNANFTIATSVSDGVTAPVTGNKAMTGVPVNDRRRRPTFQRPRPTPKTPRWI